ncbi:uncharacterized protein LOC107882427 [Acyrthosiphon pisum]|uniref:Regulatory protein zeste n=1 Tax=Acyrthosiphon pisum TaxID=7029 RepID=A0A8R2D117_ACYPI|nr:uncharacterized protein LOC107882427 [Acyrthosiphon pisum]|eukprot:XP_016656236.1 PREDICTED: uncharacterized protein LOC107882427 [Acyrthosiphon pisum]
MEMKKNRKPNTTDRQKKLLVDFMVLHPELVSGKNTSKSTVKQRQKLWESLAEALNSEVGPNKSWSEWRKTWCDLKTNVKGKAGANRKERNKTGGGELDLEVFSEFENKILEMLGPTIVEGHTSVDESAADISFFVPHSSTQSLLSNSNMVLVNEVVPVESDDTPDDGNLMWNDSCLNGLEDLIEDSNKVNEIYDCASGYPSKHLPTVSQPSIRNTYKVKTNCKLTNLQNTVAATKSFAAISQKKTKIKASYYERKLLLLEKIAAAEEKKAEALISIAQSLASRQIL